MDRKASTSITELVKTVANECIDRRLDELKILRAPQTINILAQDFINSVQKNVEKAGRPWIPEEDDLLNQEVKTAIAQIAINHKRSLSAIKSRMLQKQLIKEVV